MAFLSHILYCQHIKRGPNGHSRAIFPAGTSKAHRVNKLPVSGHRNACWNVVFCRIPRAIFLAGLDQRNKRSEGMTEIEEQPLLVARIPTGIAGLDTILNGGFFRGGNYLVEGPPGAGKTILGNQLCFHHAASGGRAIFISFLTETNSRLMDELASFAFYAPEFVGDAIYYLNGYATLEKEGWEGLLKLIRREIRGRRANLLILDGSTVIEQVTSNLEWMRFLHGLYVSSEITRCTTVLLTQAAPDNAFQPEQTVVEGIIELALPFYGMRAARELTVHKFRGSAFIEGRHHYTITEKGIVVYARSEKRLISAPLASHLAGDAPRPMGRASVGIARLDEMLRGGLPTASTTLLIGATGTGKTLLGSHFLLAGTARKESALYFGFSETPLQLERKLARFNLDATQARAEGLLEALWQSPVQDILDPLAERLLEAVQRRGVRRLFIDGLGGFQRTIAASERLDLFLRALFIQLQELEVTAICSIELPALFSPTLELPAPLTGVADGAHNLIFLRYVELQSQLYRLISILKMRESGYESAIREFRITDQGIDVASTFNSAQAILTGVALPVTRQERNTPFVAEAGDGNGERS